jgi:hypothetical protein
LFVDLIWRNLLYLPVERETLFRLSLEGIASADHAHTPSVSGRVYFLNPATGIIVHMYDDRGLDMIATNSQTLLPIHRLFNGWVLNSDRERIAKALSE